MSIKQFVDAFALLPNAREALVVDFRLHEKRVLTVNYLTCKEGDRAGEFLLAVVFYTADCLDLSVTALLTVLQIMDCYAFRTERQ